MKTILQLLSVLLTLAASAQESRLADGSTEWLHSDDLNIHSGFAAIRTKLTASTDLTARLEFMNQTIDYRPNARLDPLGSAEKIDEFQSGLQLDLERLTGKHLLSISLNAYEGFRNYSSIWINRYYRQQYGSGGIPGVSYEEPDPKGMGVGLTYRLEVIPAAGYLTLSVGFLQDEVAPGYEIEDLGNAFELVRGEEQLDTWTGSIEFEGVINDRMRTRQSIRISDTTARDFRLGWDGGLNILLNDRWIARSEASFSREEPQFKAWSLSQTFEYTLTPSWAVSVTIRAYEDSGQIEAANLISSAAPELSTRQAFLTVRYLAPDQITGASFSIGPYLSDYGTTGIGTERFLNLYRDRDWVWARLAARIAF